jgi:hypothetical protein
VAVSWAAVLYERWRLDGPPESACGRRLCTTTRVWVPETLQWLCELRVFVDQAAYSIVSDHRGGGVCGHLREGAERRCLAQGPVRAMSVDCLSVSTGSTWQKRWSSGGTAGILARGSRQVGVTPDTTMSRWCRARDTGLLADSTKSSNSGMRSQRRLPSTLGGVRRLQGLRVRTRCTRTPRGLSRVGMRLRGFMHLEPVLPTESDGRTGFDGALGWRASACIPGRWCQRAGIGR